MKNKHSAAAFTLIELLVVLTIIALLLTIAAPHFIANIDRAKEAVLREDLATLRDAIDKFYSDRGEYPGRIEQLVASKYIRKVPVDPFTDSALTWVPVSADSAASGGIIDIKSGATGSARDGTALSSW